MKNLAASQILANGNVLTLRDGYCAVARLEDRTPLFRHAITYVTRSESGQLLEIGLDSSVLPVITL